MDDRQCDIAQVKSKLRAWSSQTFFNWLRSKQSSDWQRIRHSTSRLDDDKLTDSEFKERLFDYEILWLRAIADYKYFLRNGGGE